MARRTKIYEDERHSTVRLFEDGQLWVGYRWEDHGPDGEGSGVSLGKEGAKKLIKALQKFVDSDD